MNNSMPDQQRVQPKSGFLHWIWQQRPQLINNPVIIREVTDILRKKSSFYILAITIGVGILFLLFSWRNLLDVYARVGYDHWRASREFFSVMNLIIGSAIFLLTPIFSATCINLERERDTWELLTTTPINILSILWAKIISCIFFLWILLMSLIPIYGLCFTIGGIAPEEINFVMWIFSEILVFTVMVGILCSIWIKKSIQAITSTYIIVILLFLVIPIIAIFFAERFKFPFLFGIPFVQSPLIISVCYFGSLPPTYFYQSFVCPDIYYSHAVILILMMGFILILCVFGLYYAKPQSVTQWARSIVNRFRFLRKNPPPQNETHAVKKVTFARPMNLIPNWMNPIFSKEMRLLTGRNYLRLLSSIAIWFGLFCIMLIPFSIENRNIRSFVRDFVQFLPFMAILFTPFIIIPYAVNSYRYEKDRETWNLLITTTLPSWKITWGKMLAGFLSFQWKFLSFYGFFVVFSFLLVPIHFNNSDDTTRYLLGVAWTFVMCQLTAYFVLAFGGWISAISRKTLTAYAIAFFGMIFLYLFLPLMTKMAFVGRLDFGPSNSASAYCSIFSPFFLLIEFIEFYMRNNFHYKLTIHTILNAHCFLYLCVSVFFYYLTKSFIRGNME
jgi:ABC-2 type transport system permease protein